MWRWSFIVATAVLGLAAETLEAAEAASPHIVFLVNEDQYSATKSVPAFAATLCQRFDCNCSILFGHKQEFAGLEALKTADALVLFVRRRALPAEQLAAIRAYIEAGKPLVGLRTASHAFAARANTQPPAGSDQWPSFDVDVLGGRYNSHFPPGDGANVTVASGAADHPILAGIDPAPWHSLGSLYRATSLAPDVTVLLNGESKGNQEPIAWARTHRGGRVFYTSLGDSTDFQQPQFDRLLINALFWTMNRPLPNTPPVDTLNRR